MQKVSRGLALAAGLAMSAASSIQAGAPVLTFDEATKFKPAPSRPHKGKRSKEKSGRASEFASWIHARKNMRGIPGDKMRRQFGPSTLR